MPSKALWRICPGATEGEALETTPSILERPVAFELFRPFGGEEALALDCEDLNDLWDIPELQERPRILPPSEGLVLGYYGERGQGKSLMMTADALRMWRKHKFEVVYSTYEMSAHKELKGKLGWITKGDWQKTGFGKPFTLEMLLRFPAWLHDACIVVDEIDTMLPSYRSTTYIADFWDKFLRQIRKRKVWLLWSSQFPEDLDRKLIQQSDLVGKCLSRDGGVTVPCILRDMRGKFTGMPDKKWWREPLFKGRPFWGCYDTDTTFDPLIRYKQDMKGMIAEMAETGAKQYSYGELLEKDLAFMEGRMLPQVKEKPMLKGEMITALVCEILNERETVTRKELLRLCNTQNLSQEVFVSATIGRLARQGLISKSHKGTQVTYALTRPAETTKEEVILKGG